jgi:hypothetical protein
MSHVACNVGLSSWELGLVQHGDSLRIEKNLKRLIKVVEHHFGWVFHYTHVSILLDGIAEAKDHLVSIASIVGVFREKIVS